MKGTFEITAKRNRRTSIRYITTTLYNGVANKIHDDLTKQGFKDIDIRLLPVYFGKPCRYMH